MSAPYEFVCVSSIFRQTLTSTREYTERQKHEFRFIVKRETAQYPQHQTEWAGCVHCTALHAVHTAQTLLRTTNTHAKLYSAGTWTHVSSINRMNGNATLCQCQRHMLILLIFVYFFFVRRQLLNSIFVHPKRTQMHTNVKW